MEKKTHVYIPIGSMYGIFTYIWHKSMVNVDKYSIHGSYGISVYCLNLQKNIRGFIGKNPRKTAFFGWQVHDFHLHFPLLGRNLHPKI